MSGEEGLPHGAGVAMLDDPDRAVAVARAAGEGSGSRSTVKLRPGRDRGDRAGITLARRLVDEAGVAGIAFHPRAASQQHSGDPDYALSRELAEFGSRSADSLRPLSSNENTITASSRTAPTP